MHAASVQLFYKVCLRWVSYKLFLIKNTCIVYRVLSFGNVIISYSIGHILLKHRYTMHGVWRPFLSFVISTWSLAVEKSSSIIQRMTSKHQLHPWSWIWGLFQISLHIWRTFTVCVKFHVFVLYCSKLFTTLALLYIARFWDALIEHFYSYTI